MRNTPETDYVIKCYHASADGQFDSDASVPSGAVHTERLFEKSTYVSNFITICVGLGSLVMFNVSIIYLFIYTINFCNLLLFMLCVVLWRSSR